MSEENPDYVELQFTRPGKQAVIDDLPTFAEAVIKLAEALNEVVSHITIEENDV